MIDDGFMRRIFRDSGLTATKGLVAYDAGWKRFEKSIAAPDDLARLDDEGLCRTFGVDRELLDKLVTASIRQWRISPSRSLIHILDGLGDEVPQGRMFPDIVAQSRIAFAAAKIGVLPVRSLQSVLDAKGKRAFVSHDAQAVTLDDEGTATLNEIARTMRAWELRNRARADVGLIKLPRMIFRGVRAGAVQATFERGEGEAYELAHSRRIERQVSRLHGEPLVEVLGNPILSFSATASVAEKFTANEGFVVSADPSRVRVVASWVTDGALDGKDEVLGIHEREWIVRFPADYVPAPDEIAIRDRTYAMATNDPAGITMLHHYDHATYELEGRIVEARHLYNNNGIGGRVVYVVKGGDWMPKGRQTIKRETGFDPVPGPGREAVNLVYFYEEPYVAKKRFYERHVPTVEQVEASAPSA